MTDVRMCEHCGDPLDGMRADARFHPECKDRARREKERRSRFEDMLRSQLEASLADSKRIGERVGELLGEWRRENEIAMAALFALDRLHPVRQPPLWWRLWAFVRGDWDREPTQDLESPDNGRTGAQTDA